MLDHQPLCRRRSRLVLLLAGLLYLVGTVADPIVHVYAAGAPGVAASAEGAHEDPEEFGPDEGPCMTCKLAASIALTVPAPAVSPIEARDDAGALTTGAPRAPPTHSSSQPRAPPHA